MRRPEERRDRPEPENLRRGTPWEPARGGNYLNEEQEEEFNGRARWGWREGSGGPHAEGIGDSERRDPAYRYEGEWGPSGAGAGDRMRGRTYLKPLEMEEDDPEDDYMQWDGAARARDDYRIRREERLEGRKGRKGDRLEARIEELERGRIALEKARANDRARAGLDTELRRLQSGVSSFDHPGLFSHIDKWITIHEAPVTHRGPMCVAGATADILKVPHIKLSYLGMPSGSTRDANALKEGST
jgi:hypothetical protein